MLFQGLDSTLFILPLNLKNGRIRMLSGTAYCLVGRPVADGSWRPSVDIPFSFFRHASCALDDSCENVRIQNIPCLSNLAPT